MNHVAVDRCYQCGTAFAVDDQTLETAEVGAVIAASVRGERAPARDTSRSEPSLAPLEPTPIAFSDRLEASTERVAIPTADAQPLKPFAESAAAADGDDDVDWVDPRRERAARQGMRARRRNRMAHATLAVVVLCALVAGGYYAYASGALPRIGDLARALRMNDSNTTSSAMPPIARPDEGVARNNASAHATTPASIATDARKASATPPSTNPAAAPMTPPANPSAGSETPIATQAPAPSASTTTPISSAPTEAAPAPAASNPSAPVARARGETSRRTSRNAATKPTRSVNAPQSSTDKDALATQRLIERDLSGFLGPNGSPGGPPR